MTTLKQGDLIKDKSGNTSKVMEVVGTILHLSLLNNYKKYDITADEATLKEMGYTWDAPAWEPKPYDFYVYINANGYVSGSYWHNTVDDQGRRDFLGIYQSKELCEAALLEIRRKLGK